MISFILSRATRRWRRRRPEGVRLVDDNGHVLARVEPLHYLEYRGGQHIWFAHVPARHFMEIGAGVAYLTMDVLPAHTSIVVRPQSPARPWEPLG